VDIIIRGSIYDHPVVFHRSKPARQINPVPAPACSIRREFPVHTGPFRAIPGILPAPYFAGFLEIKDMAELDDFVLIFLAMANRRSRRLVKTNNYAADSSRDFP